MKVDDFDGSKARRGAGFPRDKRLSILGLPIDWLSQLCMGIEKINGDDKLSRLDIRATYF